jgi:hypothetical protein
LGGAISLNHAAICGVGASILLNHARIRADRALIWADRGCNFTDSARICAARTSISPDRVLI